MQKLLLVLVLVLVLVLPLLVLLVLLPLVQQIALIDEAMAVELTALRWALPLMA